ncbi:AraC-like DNA-binding protein [Frondihabitans sp. PhB188]|nr:AraC-like DNA-binding protein [Frondihabitans sp. PhB188]
MRIEAQGRDIDAAVDLFQSGYNGNTFQAEATERPFFYRHTARGDRDMTLRSTRFDGHVSGVIAPGDDYVVSWLVSGTGRFDIGRSESLLDVEQLMVFPTDWPFSFDFTDVHQQLVHFHRPYLETIAAEQYGRGPGPLTLDHTVPPTGASIRAWKNTIGLVARIGADVTTSPVLQAEMTRITAIAFLGLFPPRRSDIPASLHVAKNTSLKVAVDFIHANAHLPISTTDIASASGLGLRTLQEGFRRVLETTPNAYLRGVRLDRARAELDAGRSGEVANVARRWGFGNLGRFSAAYADRFGERPGDTARR